MGTFTDATSQAFEKECPIENCSEGGAVVGLGHSNGGYGKRVLRESVHPI